MQGFRPARYQPAGTGPGRGLAGERGPDLLARARSGDREALDQLCREHWLPVYRAVCRWAQTPAEAEDLTQDVFIRAIRALGNYRTMRPATVPTCSG